VREGNFRDGYLELSIEVWQKNTGCGSNDGTTLFEEQNGRSTRARDHAYLARNWKFESIPLQRRVCELSVPERRTLSEYRLMPNAVMGRSALNDQTRS
jgi:hypothetical protein